MVVNNPNNWHWVDKNCLDWSKKYFDENLVGVSASDSDYKVEISSVSSVEGDCEVCQRKGKVISLFDLRLTFNWTGSLDSKGSIVVPELAYDTEADEIQFDLSIYNEDGEKEKLRPLLKSKLLPQLREKLEKFGPDLISTHSSDIQLASEKVNSTFTRENQTASNKPAAAKGAPSAPQAVKKTETAPTNSSVPKYNTSTLHLEPVFNTTAEQLYITLLDPQRVGAWTRSNPQMDAFPPKEKSEFKFFGGSISGEFVKLVPNERIVQKWRLEDWKNGHYAELDIQLKQGAGETTMVVKWLGIPIGEEDRVRGNFEDYYVRSIKITFGFGAVL